MSLDAKIRRTVQRVMQKIGTEVTIRRVAVGVYNPATRTVTSSEADYEVTGRLDDYTDREFVSGQVKVGDRKFTFAAADASFVPVPNDKVVIDDEVFNIVSPGGVRREMAQHEPALYVLQLRR